jgi:hypothetical protein
VSNDLTKLIAKLNGDADKYTVTWHVDVAKIKGMKRRFSLGICAKTGHVAFASTNMLEPLVVHDVYTHPEPGTCEDGQWCLDLSCPYNKANVRFMRQYGIETPKQLAKMHERLEEINGALKLETAGPHTQILYGEPAVTIKKVRKDDSAATS